ncbi:MAG: BREX-1 system adenine-specific DNA-methyltransferase PglX, partial [Oscillospiraceae bacterium]|nr:BREX-1 system adenine-specific DNA-methyltransferase PglX [Oscillospiraceae bacterium]
MDKNAIKKYAVWARRELIERVSQRAMIYGITAKDAGDPRAESINGHLLSQAEKRQRQALIRNIKAKGYEQVMEEVAYTWFNRFAALRFMEVNGYLPSHIRVFTNDAGEFKPQILAEAIHLEIDGLDMNKVYELESANKSEELFKYLLIVQCNALNSILPGMFQRIDDYTELLLPDYLLRKGSVIEQMVTTIPEEDWTDQVQIIGWLYQYYNTEPKDKVFADQKKGIKVSKENIPAATQLFTPDWIVHYMVENSLGRLWLEGHPNNILKSEWKYYLDEAEQEPEVQVQLAAIRKEYAVLKPEEIRVIDPCMGSGHILCVLFDVLVCIYEDYGYTAREAAAKIVENNLWGLDIDERAAQLSYFTVMMKARQYDRRFFTRKVQPHVYAIEESNGITSAPMYDMGLNLSQEEYDEAVKQALRLVEEMHDAKEYGSLVSITPADWNLLRRFAVPREDNGQLRLDVHGEIEASARLQQLINIGEALGQQYHSVVTNPPYMGNNGMSSKLSDFVKRYYPDSKADLFAAFIEKCSMMVSKRGFAAMITQHAWMFLASYESLRNKIQNERIINLAHLGPRAFDEISGEVVQTVSFVVNKRQIEGYKGLYIGLTSYSSEKGKEDGFLSGNERYVRKQE